MILKNIRCLAFPGFIAGILMALLVMASIPPALAGSGADDTGVADVFSSTGTGDRTWQFDVDTVTFKPDEYIVTASAVKEQATGTALFNVLERSSANDHRAPQTQGSLSRPAGSGYYITIDPIGDRYVGDRFTITGRTNLPEGAEMLVQVYSSSFRPTQKSQSGEFSGATGTVIASSSMGTVAVLSSLKTDAGIVGNDAKIIRTGSVTLVVKNVTVAVGLFPDLAVAQGGYISSSMVQASGARQTGTVVLRVPQARFETTLAGVKAIGTVKFFQTQGEDVTEEYVDLAARKKSCEIQLAQYYVLMQKAMTISDILAIQQQIDRVQTELDRLVGRLQYLNSRIDLSTITVTLQEPEPEPVSAGSGHNFGSAASKGVEGLFGLIDALIITAIVILPFLLLAGLGFCLYRWRKGNKPVVAAGPDGQK